MRRTLAVLFAAVTLTAPSFAFARPVFRAETPSFSMPAGSYEGSVTVGLSTEATDTIIRYTTNGTDPSLTTGIIYTTPIVLGRTTTLKAKGFKAAVEPSLTATGLFTITPLPAPSLTLYHEYCFPIGCSALAILLFAAP
mgnify:CR=1 FL=1